MFHPLWTVKMQLWVPGQSSFRPLPEIPIAKCCKRTLAAEAQGGRVGAGLNESTFSRSPPSNLVGPSHGQDLRSSGGGAITDSSAVVRHDYAHNGGLFGMARSSFRAARLPS